MASNNNKNEENFDDETSEQNKMSVKNLKVTSDGITSNFYDYDKIGGEDFAVGVTNKDINESTSNLPSKDDENHKDDTQQKINKSDICEEQLLSKQCSTNTNIEALTENNQRQLSNIIKELINREKNYVDGLERGIQIYVKAFDLYTRNNSAIQEKKNDIFGNIEQLYDFHKEKLLPALLACNEDIISIAKLFNNYIMEDYFYDYVLFGFYQPRAVKLSHNFKEFFEDIRKMSQDKHGVNSFLVKPIQQLPPYKLLFGEIIKAIAHDFDGLKNVKDIIRECCIAEKQIQKLMDNVYEALNLNDIDNADEINLMEQGKLRKMNEFAVVDSETNNRFQGKTFLFERALVCTELVQKTSKLKYRTLVLLDDVIFINTDNRTGLQIVTKSNRNIDFISIEKYPIVVIQEWIKLLEPLTKKAKHANLSKRWRKF